MPKEERITYVVTLVGQEWFRVRIQLASRNRLFIIPIIKDRSGKHLTVIGDGPIIATHRKTLMGTEEHVRAKPGPTTEFSKSYPGRHTYRYHFNRCAFVPTLHYFNAAKGRIQETEKERTIYYEIIRPLVELDDPVFFHSERFRDIQLMYPGYGFIIRRGGTTRVTPLNDYFAIYEPVSQSGELLEGIHPFNEMLRFFDELGPEEYTYLKQRMRAILYGKTQDEIVTIIHKLQSSKEFARFAASTVRIN